MSKGIDLKERIVKRLERTGLVTGAEIRLCDSYDVLGIQEGGKEKARMPYISFKIKGKKLENDCKGLTSYLVDELKKTKPEIVGVNYSVDSERRCLNACLVLNPAFETDNSKDFVQQVLGSLNGALKSYLYKNGINDQMRD